MFVIEVAGVFSSGKSTIVDNISKNKNVMTIQQILPIWCILKFLKESVIQNLVMELYFLLRYNLKILIKIKKLAYFDISTMSIVEKIKLYRSIVRKLGYIFVINKKRKRYSGKFLLVDEGFYQLVQNSVTLSDTLNNYNNLFNFNYRPDLLIITVASEQTIFDRSKSRVDLTSRYKKLSRTNLLNVISKSINSFNQLSVLYVKKFQCDFRNLESFILSDIKTGGVILLKNE